MHFLYLSVMDISILQILSGHIVSRTFGVGVMINFMFWPPPTLLFQNFKVDSHDQCSTEKAQILVESFVVNWSQSRK